MILPSPIPSPFPSLLLLLPGHFDEERDFDGAERLNEKAERDLDNAKKSLERQRELSQKALEELGRQKVLLHRQGLKPFVETFKRIKNMEDITASDLQVWEHVGKVEMLDLERTVVEMEEAVGAIAEALAAGALVAYAAYGSVGLLGTASTGTAIAGLSGAAARNATLAWLGGGAGAIGEVRQIDASLAAGGGVAVGTAVLGGIVAAPVSLVGGLWMMSKAEEALADARSNVKKAKTAAAAMKTAKVAANAISKKAREVQSVLLRLHVDFMDGALTKLQRLVRRSDDYRSYTTEEQHLVVQTLAVAETAYLVAEAKLIDEDGVVTKEIRGALKRANEFLRTINAM